MSNPDRIFSWNNSAPNPNGNYVLYWMQIFRRLEYNFALEHAVHWANTLQKPLLIYEGLQCDYPWASDRFHHFVMEGMRENRDLLRKDHHNYFCFLETRSGKGNGLVRALSGEACLIVTDQFPAYVIREHNEKLGPAMQVPYLTVDSNGILPLAISPKAPYSAFHFRRLIQKHFLEAYTSAPAREPLSALKVKKKAGPSDAILKRWPDGSKVLDSIPAFIQKLPIGHKVTTLKIGGTRSEALRRFRAFTKTGLLKYADLRNHPDLNHTSGMSPYLHFGKISTHEIVKAVLKKQPAGWNLSKIRNRDGSREGFFGGHPPIDAFLDQLVTWREIGYHFCHHVKNFDRYESLPSWSRTTLEKHVGDPRDFIYTLEEFESAQTHDPLWNAAQNQLVREGVIHNYLRMLWGKKIVEWSPDPRTALGYMIELNNKYSIDGRDPNSYSGIFWVLGRFDRPWAPERDIFGSVRWMSSENTARKVRLKEYQKKYS